MSAYIDAIADASLANNAAVADTNSQIATATKPSSILNADGSIAQTERLFTARSRSAGSDVDRGSHGYIKLLTSGKQYKAYADGDTSTRQVTYKDLLGTGADVPTMSDPSPTASQTYGYDKFLITSVASSMTEKTQVTEIFGDNEVVYYFGRQAMIFTISGILVDSPDNSWFVQWMKIYSEFLRGSKLAENYELLSLVLPNMKLTGSISGFNWTQDSSRDVDIPFSFQFIAKSVEPISTEGLSMPTSNRLSTVDFSQVAAFTGQSQINTLKNQAANLTGVLSDPSSSLSQKAAAYSALGTTTGGAFDTSMANVGGSIAGFQGTVEGWNSSQSQFFSSIKSSALFQSVTSSLTGIRMNLFSPVYGVLSSLTKLVSNTLNSITGILSAVISPVRGILQDITNISHQAVALVNLVNSSITGLGRYVTGSLKGLTTDFNSAIAELGKAAGALATAPITAAQSVAGMFASSALAYNAPFIQTSSKIIFSRPILPAGSAPPPTKASLLISVGKYTNTPASL